MQISVKDLGHLIRQLPDADKVPTDHFYAFMPVFAAAMQPVELSGEETVAVGARVRFVKRSITEPTHKHFEWTLEVELAR